MRTCLIFTPYILYFGSLTVPYIVPAITNNNLLRNT